MKNVAKLEILSWVGVQHDAIHFYGTLHTRQSGTIELTHQMTTKDAVAANKKARATGYRPQYKRGDITAAWLNLETLYEAAINANSNGPRQPFIIIGSAAGCSVGECIMAPTTQIKKRINDLWQGAEKLDYYSGADDERMERIDIEFREIIMSERAP